MALSEKEIPELQEIYRRLFYKNYDVNTYRFLGVHFVTGEREPVVLMGRPHASNENIYLVADTNGITQICSSFDEAKREIGV